MNSIKANSGSDYVNNKGQFQEHFLLQGEILNNQIRYIIYFLTLTQ
jgi:hypothetical protein